MTLLPRPLYLTPSMVASIEIYGYHDSDIVVMTDEEENKNTKHWPSKENIEQAMIDLVSNASDQDTFVFYCEPLRHSAFAC